MNRPLLLAAALAIGGTGIPRIAEACGCFTPPNLVERMRQAEERIVFARDGNAVEMHVQINYTGEAEEFGWLLPVPADPEVSVGVDGLFDVLEATTAPRFVTRVETAHCRSRLEVDAGSGSSGPPRADSGSADAGADPSGPLLSREEVGPFDVAVLSAADAEAMIDWLNDNRFVVPVQANDPAIQAYIGPGRAFVALKLLSDRDAGDIQPIVLRFDSGGLSIPITLTQVGAEPDMPVIVWTLGEERAIPRNYRHTVINEEHIDWFSGGSNYRDVVTRAVDEAEGAHSFVTEYASAYDLSGNIFRPSSFPARADIEAAQNAADIVPVLVNSALISDSKLLGILRRSVPYPDAASERGISEDEFYQQFFQWFAFGELNGLEVPVDGVGMAEAIWTEIVEPRMDAQEMLDRHSYMTRLFTTLSPEEMTIDPAFDFSPMVGDVSRDHSANFKVFCGPDGFPTERGVLTLPDGRQFITSPDDWRGRESVAPFSRAIQALTMDEPPRDVVNNEAMLSPSEETEVPPGAFDPEPIGSASLDSEGCRNAPGAWLLPLLVLPLLAARRRAS